MARRLARAQEHARHVHGDDLVPVLQRELGRGPADRDAGVVEEDVEPAVPRDDVGERRLDLRLVGDVHRIGVVTARGQVEDRHAGTDGGEGSGH
ncbi:MAG TPA: hypothetical protein VFX28_14470, partial [Methylomirabilota bacterium]|nr:hypothetical protein [Methylomirabilota bacterium]